METSTKITWITGLIIAILTAVLSYLNTSCSLIKEHTIEADSISISNLKYKNYIDITDSWNN